MLRLWTPKCSGSARPEPCRRVRKPALRIPLSLERCEDRLAAGQLFSFLSAPLGALDGFARAPLTREAADRSPTGFLRKVSIQANQVGYTPAAPADEFSREQVERLQFLDAPTASAAGEDDAEALWATANFTDSDLQQSPITALGAPFARPSPDRPRLDFARNEGSLDQTGAPTVSVNLSSALTGSFDIASATPQLTPTAGTARQEAATLALLAGETLASAPLNTVALRGTLEVLGATAEDGRHQNQFYLDTGETKLPLKVDASFDQYLSGTIMSVRGVLGTEGLAVDPESVVVHQTPPENEDGEGAGRAVRWILVINVNFSDRVQQPWSVATARNLFTNNIANWFSQGSYGQTTIVADVVGWYTIASTSTSCATGTWSSQAQARARSAGWEPNNYNHVVIAFPRVPACSWAGLGQVPGRLTWLNNAMNLNVAVHELGHNLGLAHSKSLRCSTGPLSGSCTTTEYGDRYDVMGRGGPAHYHASYRAYVGWIPSGSRRTLTPSVGEAVVALRPAESSSGTRLLRVQRRGRSDYLHVEARSATGSDSVLNQYSNLMNGVAIYLGTSLRDQKVIDFTYNTSSAGDAAVRFNNILWDWVGDVLILPMYRTNGVTYVYVRYGIN